MSGELVGFDAGTAMRVLAATRKVEAFPLGQPDIRENSSVGFLPPQTVIFRVTNATPSNGFYQCQWLAIDVLATGSPAITFTLDGQQGWAYGLNNTTLQQGVDYFGKFEGYKPDDGRAVFVTGDATGGGGGGGSLSLYELDPLTIAHGENFINVAGMSFPSYLISGGGYFDLQVDPITANTVALFIRSQGSFGGAYSVLWSGTQAQATTAPYSRFTTNPTVFGIQLGVRAAFANGVLVFGNATNGNTVSLVTGVTAATHSYTMPITPNQTAGSSGDLYLRRTAPVAGNSNLYWDAAGGTMTVHEIDFPSAYTVTLAGVTRLSFRDDHFIAVADPLNATTGAAIAIHAVADDKCAMLQRPPGNLGGDEFLKTNWSKFPWLEQGLNLGLDGNGQAAATGQLKFWHSENKSVTFESRTGSGDVTYKWPLVADICNKKVLHITSGTNNLDWKYATMLVNGVESSRFDFNTTDFSVSTSQIGTPPCQETQSALQTSGFSGAFDVMTGFDDSTCTPKYRTLTYTRGLLKTVSAEF